MFRAKEQLIGFFFLNDTFGRVTEVVISEFLQPCGGVICLSTLVGLYLCSQMPH